jgi:hypothetical protein
MFGYLGWMGILVVLLTAVGVIGYIGVVVRCAEEEFRNEAVAGRRPGETLYGDAESPGAVGTSDRPTGRAA